MFLNINNNNNNADNSLYQLTIQICVNCKHVCWIGVNFNTPIYTYIYGCIYLKLNESYIRE